MSLLLLFFWLDSFSLRPYTISRRSWVRKIQSTRERHPFGFCLWWWETAFDGRTAICAQTNCQQQPSKRIWRPFCLLRRLHSSAAVSTLIPTCGSDVTVNSIFYKHVGWNHGEIWIKIGITNEALKHSNLFQTKLQMLKLTFLSTLTWRDVQ